MKYPDGTLRVELNVPEGRAYLDLDQEQAIDLAVGLLRGVGVKSIEIAPEAAHTIVMNDEES